MHPGIWWLLGSLAWIPAGYGLALILKDWLAARRKERAARPIHLCSVTAIAARIERERAEEAAAAPEVRWPRIDCDDGEVRDARPTVPIPRQRRRSVEEALTEPCLPPLEPPRRVRVYVGMDQSS